MASLELGFVGIGRMGAPMARRLIATGHAVTVCDPDEAAVGALVAEGARHAASPAETAGMADYVFLSLPMPDVVRSVALGAGGLIEGTRARAVIDLSTTGPRVVAEVAERLGEKDIATLDCPVSGGVAGAEKGTLALMAAGERSLYETLEPVLTSLGRPFHVGGKPGMGQMMKVINNLMSVTAIAISSEALVLGTKAGLDADTMIEVINAGSGRNTATTDKIPNFVLPRSFDFGFAIGLSAKDVKLCLDESDALGVPMIVGSAVRQLLGIARAMGGDEADLTTLIRPVEDWAGIEVRGAAAK